MKFDWIPEAIAIPFRGTGGAIAVIQAGELKERKIWGYSDMESRTPLTSRTLMPICSITKQMVCGIFVGLGDSGLVNTVQSTIDKLLSKSTVVNSGISIEHLCNNQSGIRDYWAVTTLLGARPDGVFSSTEHWQTHLRSFVTSHFPPGREYAYSNTGFRLLGQALESALKTPLGELLHRSIFQPAGMKSATLCMNTAQHPQTNTDPNGCTGYEGNTESCFVPARNRIEWAGDAGVVASLGDMIAYERHVDKLWQDPRSWYRTAAARQTFADGVIANYSYGLSHIEIGPVATVGHAGAIRGFRVARLHAPERRLSVVVMFNHEADAMACAEDVLRHGLGVSAPIHEVFQTDSRWKGAYYDDESDLAVVVEAADSSTLQIRYAGYAEILHPTSCRSAVSRETRVDFLDDGSIQMQRSEDNRTVYAKRLRGSPGEGYQGEYRCDSLDGHDESVSFHCVGEGFLLYGWFGGLLGTGPAHVMRHLGGDVWILSNPRGMDAPPPGDWTVSFRRATNGSVSGVTIGCWLARRFEYRKIGISPIEIDLR